MKKWNRWMRLFRLRLPGSCPGPRNTWLADRLGGEDGQSLVEFAITSVVLLLFVCGLMWACLLFFRYSTAAEAAREATRWASVRGQDSATGGTCNNQNITECPATIAQIESYANSLVGSGSSNMTATAVWCTTYSSSINSSNCNTTQTTATAGNFVMVQVSFSAIPLPFVAVKSLSLSSTSEMAIY
jgi:Flp pilus assembly protein TadG